MNSDLTEDTKAILLLCGVFGKKLSEKPLSQREYTALVRWLVNARLRPGDLLRSHHLSQAAEGAKISEQRLEILLGRGVELGFAVETWQRNGIWILSRSDSAYPTRFKAHLKTKAPPILFGVGDLSLLERGGLAVVGSRNVDEKGGDFARQTAVLCALQTMAIVSGGARGVDQLAMTAALESGGAAVGVVADNLLRKSVDRQARHAIADHKLVLLSPYHPDARFTVGTAMARNKLIYALADYALVVSADYKKGGTWAGAVEELKRENGRPIFVWSEADVPAGNHKLLDLGGIKWPADVESGALKEQLEELARNRQKLEKGKNLPLFDLSSPIKPASEETGSQAAEPPRHPEKTVVTPALKSPDRPQTVYEAVLPLLLENLDSPTTADELARNLDVAKTQLNKWLKKAVDEGTVRKLSRPVRYVKVEKDGTE